MTGRPRPRWTEHATSVFGIPRHVWFVGWMIFAWLMVLRHMIGGAVTAGTPDFAYHVWWGSFDFFFAIAYTSLSIWLWPTPEEKAETSARRRAKRAERRARRTTPPTT
jgi:hypothetical protein